eukprot:TRINITY_DN59194_c0_g1_i1.p2 TRINITY_DN59194_c0_g1~~TRINITY_DN59194_c0_g1_i1.p2  ORF type:complete len:111 (-),score=1.10 TRINITY_DN59194_c0_g1_i1:376-708(-)
MLTSIGFLSGGVCGLMLLLAAWQVMQYRDEMKLILEEPDSIPAIVIIELLIALISGFFSAHIISGELKPIYTTHIKLSMDMNTHRMDFVSFGNRGSKLALGRDIPGWRPT